MMWANLHFLFWLSLIPFITAWVGEYPRVILPAALYGFLGMLAGIAFYILIKTVAKTTQRDGGATTQNINQKAKVSAFCYILGIVLAFVSPILSYSVYALVAMLWIIPDEGLARRGDNGS